MHPYRYTEELSEAGVGMIVYSFSIMRIEHWTLEVIKGSFLCSSPHKSIPYWMLFYFTVYTCITKLFQFWNFIWYSPDTHMDDEEFSFSSMLWKGKCPNLLNVLKCTKCTCTNVLNVWKGKCPNLLKVEIPRRRQDFASC